MCLAICRRWKDLVNKLYFISTSSLSLTFFKEKFRGLNNRKMHKRWMKTLLLNTQIEFFMVLVNFLKVCRKNSISLRSMYNNLFVVVLLNNVCKRCGAVSTILIHIVSPQYHILCCTVNQYSVLLQPVREWHPLCEDWGPLCAGTELFTSYSSWGSWTSPSQCPSSSSSPWILLQMLLLGWSWYSMIILTVSFWLFSFLSFFRENISNYFRTPVWVDYNGVFLQSEREQCLYCFVFICVLLCE